MSSISPISIPHVAPQSLPSVGAAPPETGATFQQVLMNGLGEANTMQHGADRMVERLFTGGDVNPAEALIAVQKADLAFRLLMQVRNKLVQAYQEIKDIRV